MPTPRQEGKPSAHQEWRLHNGEGSVPRWFTDFFDRVIAYERALGDQEMEEALKVTENTSDGYHTFKELYEFRKLYNAALFNEWSAKGLYEIHKSTRHADGDECFGGGWFIVMANLPTGQISNHYEMKDWDLFQCEEREKAYAWDGHTAGDVAVRLAQFIQSNTKR